MIGWFLFVGYGLNVVSIGHMLLAKKRPAATLAWIWFLLLAPMLGAVVYFALGADRMRRRRLRRANHLHLPPTRVAEHLEPLLETEEKAKQSLLQSLAVINQIPTSSARSVELLVDAGEFYPELEDAIRSARHHIHIEFFIWRPDSIGRRFLNLLVEAAERGVAVRVVLDQLGCIGTPASFFDPLTRAGGKFAWFYSLPYHRHIRFINLRNHRKLQIIDGSTAFVGGMNIGDEYAAQGGARPRWRDAQLKLCGGVVAHLQEAFATDWCFATKEEVSAPEFYHVEGACGEHLAQIVAGGPDLPREPVPKSLAALCAAAEKRLWLATGYFCPDALMLTGLQICAARGVDVRVLVSEKSDHPYLVMAGRSFYDDLLRFGVRVFEYSAGINHAKAVLLDDDWLMVGSANSDKRSMRLNFELNVLVRAPEAARELERMMQEDFAVSREIRSEDLKNLPWHRRLLEAALRPLAPML